MNAFPDHLDAFLHTLLKRLAKGQQTYGSASFERPPEELLDELQQEALDLAGWGYILFAKIEKAKAKVREAKKP